MNLKTVFSLLCVIASVGNAFAGTPGLMAGKLYPASSNPYLFSGKPGVANWKYYSGAYDVKVRTLETGRNMTVTDVRSEIVPYYRNGDDVNPAGYTCNTEVHANVGMQEVTILDVSGNELAQKVVPISVVMMSKRELKANGCEPALELDSEIDAWTQVSGDDEVVFTMDNGNRARLFFSVMNVGIVKMDSVKSVASFQLKSFDEINYFIYAEKEDETSIRARGRISLNDPNAPVEPDNNRGGCDAGWEFLD